MCAGAMLHARIVLVFGAADPKGGAAVSLIGSSKDRLNHAVAVTEGVLREACAKF